MKRKVNLNVLMHENTTLFYHLTTRVDHRRQNSTVYCSGSSGTLYTVPSACMHVT
jgi:hypothetical protein